MTDTLKRIFGPANAASGTSTVFTGAANHIYTIKHISIVNPTSAAITIKMGISADTALADAELILPTATIDAGGLAEFDGLAIMAGVELLVAVTSATGLTITGSGLDQG